MFVEENGSVYECLKVSAPAKVNKETQVSINNTIKSKYAGVLRPWLRYVAARLNLLSISPKKKKKDIATSLLNPYILFIF